MSFANRFANCCTHLRRFPFGNAALLCSKPQYAHLETFLCFQIDLPLSEKPSVFVPYELARIGTKS